MSTIDELVDAGDVQGLLALCRERALAARPEPAAVAEGSVLVDHRGDVFAAEGAEITLTAAVITETLRSGQNAADPTIEREDLAVATGRTYTAAAAELARQLEVG